MSKFAARFNDLKINLKIMLGFAALLMIMMVLSGTGYVTITRIGDELDALAQAANISDAMGEIESEFLSFRRYAREYELTGNPEDAAKAAELRPLLAKSIGDGLAAVQEQEMRAKLTRIKEDFTAYAKDFDEIVKKRQDEDRQLREKLDPAGDQLQAAASALFQDRASLIVNSEAVLLGNAALEQLMVARLNANKIFGRREMDGKKATEEALEKLAGILSKLEGIIDTAQGRAALAELRKEMAEFQHAFQAALVDAEEMDRLLNGDMKQIAEDLADNVHAVKKHMHEQEQQGEQKAHGLVSQSTTALFVFSVLAAAFGAFLSQFIGNRISHPVRVITDVLRQIAGGNKSIDVPFVERLDEVGDNARAAEVFKQNLVRIEQQLGDLSSMAHSVSKMVESVRHGDLSGRLDETSEYAEARAVARGVNELTQSISGVLSQVMRVLSALAGGDLQMRMEGDYSGHFLTLKNDLNTTCDQLSAITGTIASSAVSVKTATDEIVYGISDLSTRTENQASAIEETSASLEELAATVEQNASSAQRASQAAEKVRELASGSSAVAERAVAAMSQIEKSSRQITEVVGLIEEIAFQTNILALNAAVEAARAGDSGRGFAVVAGEVRALSQRSSQALKEVRDLVTEAHHSIADGVKFVDQAGKSLTEIAGSVTSVTSLMSEIAVASREQATSVEQVNQAVSAMEQMTQQNAALVEETTAAVRSTQGQVNALKEAAGFFRIDANHVVPEGSHAAHQTKASKAEVRRPPSEGRQGTWTGLKKKAVGAGSSYSDWNEF